MSISRRSLSSLRQKAEMRSGYEEQAVRRYPAGLRTLPPPKLSDDMPKVHQDTCGRGSMVDRCPHLDEGEN